MGSAPFVHLTNTEDLDWLIGSILEMWLTRNTDPDQCQFCNGTLNYAAEPAERFCDDECQAAFEQVQEARTAIGERDLDQWGSTDDR